MVRIPVYDSEAKLNVGSEFFRPINTEQAEKDISRGLNSLGTGLSSVGLAWEKQNDRDDKFAADATVLDLADVASKTLDEEATQNMPRDGRGFHNAVMARITKMGNDALASVPESQRQYAELKIQGAIFDMSKRALDMERNQQRAFISEVTKETLKRVEENVKLGAWDQTRATDEINSFLANSGLTPVQREQMREVMIKTSAMARVEHLRTTKPELFVQEAQKYLPNSVRADASDLQKTIAYQAAAYGEDPRQVLLTAGLESNFNPNAGGKGTIRGTFQMTKAERQRLAAKIGTTEEAILKDPAMGAAAASLLVKENRQFLEGNGLPATPMTMYAAHFLGKSGALHFLRADPDADALALYTKLDPGAVAAGAFKNNGSLLREGMTVGEVLAAIDGKVQRGLKDVDAIMSNQPVKDGPVTILGETIPGIQPGDIVASHARAQADVVKRTTDRLLTNARDANAATPSLANSYDPVWRKEQDDIEKKEQHGQKILTGDQNVYSAYVNYGQQHGYLPSGVVAAARKMINTPGSPQLQLQGYELLASVAKSDPVNGLKNSRVGGDQDTVGNNDAAKIRDYINLTTHLGFGSEPAARINAIQQIEKTHAEDWKVKEARVNKDREDFVRGRTFSELDDGLKLSRGWLRGLFSGGSYDKRPQDAMVQARIEQMYQERTRYWYTETGNKDIAKANAMADINRSVGYTRLGGKPIMSLHPPENNYPSAVPLPLTSNGRQKTPSELTDQEHKAAYGYITQQAKAEVLAARTRDLNNKLVDVIPKKYRDQIKDSDIALEVTGNTKRDIEAGRTPRYNVNVRIDGEWTHVLADFKADPMLGREVGERRASNVTGPPPPPAPPSQDAQNRRDAFRNKRGN
jgi:hypothetical protein